MVSKLADKATCSVFEERLNPKCTQNNCDATEIVAEFLIFMNQKINEGFSDKLLQEFVSQLGNKKFVKYFEKRARLEGYYQICGQQPDFNYVLAKYIAFKGGIDGISKNH